MALVDDRGRLFGRFNLLDVVLAVVLIGLIPLAYGAYILFRAPLPRLTSVEPGSLVVGPNLRVVIKGENFRPYMRVSFNTIQGNSFVFRSAGEAVIDLNPMPPGVYDVVLYDISQERSRLSKALTLLPTPLPDTQVLVVGNFGNLSADRGGAITKGVTIEGLGTVVDVGKPVPESTRVQAGPILEIPVEKAVRVPAVIRMGCSVRAPQGHPQCVLGDAVLAPSVIVFVETAAGRLPFQIDQLRGPQPVEQVTATVQFEARSVVLENIARGDVDQGEFANELSAGARVTTLSGLRSVGNDMARVDVTMAIPAQRNNSSWLYNSTALRAGASITMRTSKYELTGTVIQVTPSWDGTRETPAATR
jgi:hypothetical protein